MLVASCLAGLIALAAPSPAIDLPDSQALSLDGTRSHAAFSVKVLWMFSVEGQFGSVRGSVNIDRLQAQATVDAYLDAAEVTMRREGALAWVKSAEFFDVAHHPEIHFRSDAFPLSRLNLGGQIPGALTMRGVTQPVVFDVLPAACERPAMECAIEAVGSVNRSEFGMHTRRATLADKVELSLSIHVVKAPQSAAES